MARFQLLRPPQMIGGWRGGATESFELHRPPPSNHRASLVFSSPKPILNRWEPFTGRRRPPPKQVRKNIKSVHKPSTRVACACLRGEARHQKTCCCFVRHYLESVKMGEISTKGGPNMDPWIYHFQSKRDLPVPCFRGEA